MRPKRIDTIKEISVDNTTDNRIKEREIELRYMASHTSDEDSDLDIALKRVRDIPLEQYLSQEKAAKVRDARAKARDFSGQKKGRRGRKGPHGKGSEDNKSLYADSRYMLSGWSDMD